VWWLMAAAAAAKYVLRESLSPSNRPSILAATAAKRDRQHS